MIGFKGAPTGILVGLAFAGLAWFITGMASAALIFGVVFGGVIYAVTRYRALYGKPAVDGFGGSSDDMTWDDDTSSWSASSPSSDPTSGDTSCDDSGSDSGSCDSGGGGGD
ncbi:hypothetical protein [Caulobacter sp. UNC279MFTsu5.1]|uniref:hypothetical protein n=1 Tax=Caulobacter sp. UNC279MFTsu5.1 TaxID=1502775 RepID=UPI0008E7B8F1|nr:hypothetical protein [Caulobacter sp. UNC279MFTsu5.1]SFI72930.1 hypothetical protein SAMN02799626_00456 [Caulobacter sp. UNC279MFTsu5.1]